MLDGLEKRLVIDDDLFAGTADVAIGIGIDVSTHGYEASPYSKAVALKALELFNDNKVDNILLTGGYKARPQGPTEAEAMQAEILRFKPSFPEDKLFLENEANKTWFNAQKTLPIVKDHKWKSAVVVAQQWHARRVRATFEKTYDGWGIELYFVKAPSEYGGGSQSRLNSFPKFAAWDTVAYLYSMVKGFAKL